MGVTAALLLALLPGISGCEGDARSSRMEVRDSAGVRIVEQGRRDEAPVYRTAELVYRTGWLDSDYNFDGIRGGVLLSNGDAALGDFGPRQIVVLDESGSVKRVVGREGRGPTEIGRIWSIHRLPGDTILIEDKTNYRYALFHGAEHVRNYRADSQTAVWLTVRNVLGRDLLTTPGGFPVSFPEPWFRAPLVVHPLGSERFDTIAHWDLAAHTEPGATRSPFRSMGEVSASGESILIARADIPQVRVMERTGRITRLIRWTDDPTPVTDSVWTVYEEGRRRRFPDTSEEDLREHMAGVRGVVEEHLPHIGVVLGDRMGRVWVSDYSVDYRHDRYWVFDLEGEVLGWVELPLGVRILDIAADAVLGQQENELGVEAAVLFRLREPGTDG